MYQLMKKDQTCSDRPTESYTQNMTPTEMVRQFRQRVSQGCVPLPFTEGVTPEQQEDHSKKLREKAGIVF